MVSDPALVPSQDYKTAPQFLNNAAHLLKKRGEEYDKQSGERSMQSTVAAFNAVSGKSLTVVDGWIFMILLKIVRLETKPGHGDSAEDLVAYAALCAEEATKPTTLP